VTWSRKVAEDAMQAIPEFWAQMGAQRSGFSKTVLGGPMGGIVLARDEAEAIAFCNDYAPEHLGVHSDEPFQYLGRLEHAGEILLGRHTLPTSGWAKTGSPLTVHDFMKRTSVAYVTAKGYPELARHAEVIATYEGFDGHANAVSETRNRLLRTNR
jgi:histidinol dehydrogenase